MDENTSQDVVNQVQSADASAPVDVSASTIDTPAAGAASLATSIPNNTASTAPALDKNASGAAWSESIDTKSSGGQEDVSGDAATANTQQAMVNGTNGSTSNPPSVGQSAESDTDASKNDTSETASKGGDAPKSTFKKPAAFKPLSVTKTFKAKQGTPMSQTANSPLEANGSGSAASGTLSLSSARPRLVAKTGSGHKISMSTQLSNAAKAGRPVGPDPMQVWNRNRVQAPQATPKHLTDEELRQQYGIQLASIPVIDGDDKGNKWADIDDEEDDWAPEVIEWSDGSKVNLAEAEKAAAEQAKAAEEAKKKVETSRFPQSATRPTLSLGPKATVLKVGGAASQAKANAEGSSLKAMDKPTLVAKPVAPAAVKSPWAPLPPVEKVPPVAVNTQPPSMPPQRSHFTENQAPDRAQAGWRAAKEIAADDFSRMPRDAPNGMPRELFNSQSGKYEPVNDARRGSIKKDQNFRQPSFLQRPGPDSETGVPPRKESQDRSMSITSDRRPSITQPSLESRQSSEQAQPWRRPSNNWSGQPRATPQSPALASASVSQAVPDAASASSPPVQHEAQAQAQAPPAPPVEDPVAMQQRLMKESRAAAVRRRQEQEAREEAERKERIKLKLQSLPPVPDKKEKSEAGQASPAKPALELAPSNSSSTKSSTAKRPDASHSPPKPPAPGPSMQRYGMIKVHPSPVANGVSPVARSANVPAATDTPMERQSSGTEPSQVKRLGETPSLNDHRAVSKPPFGLTPRDRQPEEPSPWEKAAWGQGSDVGSLSSSNLWAPQGLQRSLGNGDFSLPPGRGGPFRQSPISPEQILPSPQSAPQSTMFGEPNHASSSMQSQPSSAFGRHFEAGPRFGHKASAEAHPHPQPPNTQSRTPALPSPLAHGLPSQHGLPPPPSQLASLPEPKVGVSAWNSFSANIADHDAATRSRLNQEALLRASEAESRGQSLKPSISERWVQTSRSDDVGSRRVVGVQKSARAQAPGPPASQSISIPPEEPRQPPVSMPPQNSKPSKFSNVFKQLGQGSPPASMTPPPPQRPASPPIPPPDSYQHPAFDRAGSKPLVNLPGMNKEEDRPVPRVRLPPPKPFPQHPVGDSHTARRFLQPSAQPLVKNLDWQHRFKTLLHKDAKERRIQESGEFSASKGVFDILSVSEAAAVSFPQPGQISPTSPTFARADLGVKSIEHETALFEADLHPGSTPPVRVPPYRFPPNWRSATVSHLSVQKAHKFQFHDSDITSCRTWIVGREDFRNGKLDISIRIPGMAAPVKKQMIPKFIKDPRPPRQTSTPKNKSQSKPTRKPRDAAPAGTQPMQLGAASTVAAKASAPPVPAVPQTWASRLAAN